MINLIMSKASHDLNNQEINIAMSTLRQILNTSVLLVYKYYIELTI